MALEEQNAATGNVKYVSPVIERHVPLKGKVTIAKDYADQMGWTIGQRCTYVRIEGEFRVTYVDAPLWAKAWDLMLELDKARLIQWERVKDL